MAHFAQATIEENKNGATNPTTGDVWDRFVHVRFATGERTALHDDGVVRYIPRPGTNVEDGVKVEPITTGLRTDEQVDILIFTSVRDPQIGAVLPLGWRLHLDLSGADEARLACRIVNPQWRVPALAFRAAYPPYLERPHILVASDIGRFVVSIVVDHGKRRLSSNDVQAGDYIWWTGYQRFVPLCFL